MKTNTMKNKISILFMSILIFSLFNIQAQHSSDFNTVIEKEAKKLKKNKVLYQEYLAKEDSLFFRYNNRLKNSPQLHVHIRPDLRTLEMPLAYYYIRFKGSKNKERYREYLYAISASKDSKNRLDFVLDIKKKHKDLSDRWEELTVRSANAIWANNLISSAELKLSNEKREYSLSYYRNKNNYQNTFSELVINYWADSLNLKNKEKTFTYLHKLYSNGASYYRDADFELLYKLKPIETQNKLLEYLYYNGSPDNSTIVLFADFTTKNIPAASKLIALRKEMPLGEQKYINTAIYFMNPEQGRKEVVSFLEKEILGKSAMEDNYFNARKVLKNYAINLCKSSADISILINYLKSDKRYVFGDITRAGVLEAIYKTSPKHFENVLLDLRGHKEKTGNDLKILEVAEEIKVEIKNNK